MTERLTEGQHKGEFIVNLVDENRSDISVDQVTFASGNGVIADGTVVKNNGSGKVVPITGAVDSDDSTAEDIAGIAYGSYDTGDGDVKGVVVARLAVVDSSKLTIPGSNDSAVIAWLKKNLHIVAR